MRLKRYELRSAPYAAAEFFVGPGPGRRSDPREFEGQLAAASSLAKAPRGIAPWARLCGCGAFLKSSPPVAASLPPHVEAQWSVGDGILSGLSRSQGPSRAAGGGRRAGAAQAPAAP